MRLKFVIECQCQLKKKKKSAADNNSWKCYGKLRLQFMLRTIIQK